MCLFVAFDMFSYVRIYVDMCLTRVEWIVVLRGIVFIYVRYMLTSCDSCFFNPASQPSQNSTCSLLIDQADQEFVVKCEYSVLSRSTQSVWWWFLGSGSWPVYIIQGVGSPGKETCPNRARPSAVVEGSHESFGLQWEIGYRNIAFYYMKREGEGVSQRMRVPLL